MYDFEHRDTALKCRSELTTDDGVIENTIGCLVGNGDSPIACDWDARTAIPHSGVITRGWSAKRSESNGRRLHTIIRKWNSPEEGYYNCRFRGDINPLAGLYILYPRELLSHDE